MLTWYAIPACARPSGSWELADPCRDRQHDVYGVEAISTGVLVLSYTELCDNPPGAMTAVSRTGAQGKTTSPLVGGLGGHGI